MSWKLYSKKYIEKGLNGRAEYTDYSKTVSFLITLLYYVQVPVFWLLSIPCRIPIIDQIYEFVASNWKRGTIGFILRGIYWKVKIKTMGQDVFVDKGVSFFPDAKMVEIGNNVHVDVNVNVNANGMLIIGNNVHISSQTFINCKPFVVIENDVVIGANCAIFGGASSMWHGEIEKVCPPCPLSKGHHDIFRGVLIKKFAALAPGVIVAPRDVSADVVSGSKDIKDVLIVGEGSIIGVNSYVKDDIEDYAMCVGSPAKKILDWRIIVKEYGKKNNKMYNDMMEYYLEDNR
jgi:acetyltransferase-like isoleucine patch superfamily enzyme